MLLAACSGDTPGESAEVPAPGDAIGTDELFAATASAVEGELWIVGGLRAPEGTSPPSSLIGPQWQPSTSVQVYDADGTIVRRLELPGPDVRIVATVVAVGDDRYVVGSRCAEAAYCNGPATPALFRIDGDAIDEVDLAVPPANLGDSVSAGRIEVVGQGDGALWVTQDLGLGSEIFDGVRLLSIDLADGTVTEVPLPDGVRDGRSFCAGTAGVFVVSARLGERSELAELTILRRPNARSDRDWEELVSIPVDLGYVGGGAIDCDDAAGDVVVSLLSSPPTVAAVDAATGVVTTPFTPLSESGVEYLGRIDSAGILLSSTASGVRSLWRRDDGGTVSRLDDVTIDRRAQPIVLAGRLVDIQSAASQLDDEIELPLITTGAR